MATTGLSQSVRIFNRGKAIKVEKGPDGDLKFTRIDKHSDGTVFPTTDAAISVMESLGIGGKDSEITPLNYTGKDEHTNEQ